MSAALDQHKQLLPGRFAFLMGLYAENYHRLVHLFAPQRLTTGVYASDVCDGLPVHLMLKKCHPYTLEMELTYVFVDAQTGCRSPSAQLRLYTDAHVAEVTHCHPERHLWQILGPFPPAHTVFQHRLRMNGFLSRWLEYLMGQGHGIHTLTSMPSRAG